MEGISKYGRDLNLYCLPPRELALIMGTVLSACLLGVSFQPPRQVLQGISVGFMGEGDLYSGVQTLLSTENQIFLMLAV